MNWSCFAGSQANVPSWRILLKKSEIGLPQKFDQMTF